MTTRHHSMTNRPLALALALCSAVGGSAGLASGLSSNGTTKPAKPQHRVLTNDERLAFIRAAQLWSPTDVPKMDIRLGPQGRGALPPDAEVRCSYVEAKRTGSSLKFDCALEDHTIVKVRYGLFNGKVEASVVATRLLWALGFGADRVYPAHVVCDGCSSDPWNKRARVPGSQVFDPAVIERKPEGHEMDAKEGKGWTWPELALVDPGAGGAPREQIDALTLLAVFMQHTDSKSDQQRLLCLPGGLEPDGSCTKPFLMLHDVGLTFGHANFLNVNGTSSLNFDEWKKTPIWRDASLCTAHMSRSFTGTIENPKIGEAGRAFLANLLLQLSDHQLRDLFEVARVEGRSHNPNQSKTAPGGTVDEWVETFKEKRAVIATSHCPA